MNSFTLPAQTHIGYAHLNTADLSRSLDFYGEKMGFQRLADEDGTAVLSADGTTPHIKLTEHRDWLPKPQRSTGLYHVAIRVPNRQALANLFGRLVSQRYPFGGFSDHLVSEALYLDDPDGNGLELYHDRPRSQWTYLDNKQVKMSTLALDVEKLLGEANLEGWSGIDKGTDIGHVHLHIADLKQARAFYVDLLGLEIASDWSSNGALFVSAGGYHHHLGLNIWAGSQRQPPGTLGLREYTLVIPGADAFGQLQTRLNEAGVKAEPQPDNSLLIHDQVGNVTRLVNTA